MDFIRFTGEWFVYFVLLGLGGAVLIALTVGLFSAIGMDVTRFVAGVDAALRHRAARS